MTTREAFEAVFTSAKAYTNETTGDYLQPYLQAWQAWQAATDAALERAAEVCVDISAHQLTFQQRKSAATCAAAIRALKESKE
jgi:hypothetical protein